MYIIFKPDVMNQYPVYSIELCLHDSYYYYGFGKERYWFYNCTFPITQRISDTNSRQSIKTLEMNYIIRGETYRFKGYK